jgi:hypothetical protein
MHVELLRQLSQCSIALDRGKRYVRNYRQIQSSVLHPVNLQKLADHYHAFSLKSKRAIFGHLKKGSSGRAAV